MKSFHLTVSSPDGDLFSGEVLMLSVRGSEGDLAVMAGHIPFITAVRPCVCQVDPLEGEEFSASTDGGLLTVTAEGATLLTGSFAREE